MIAIVDAYKITAASVSSDTLTAGTGSTSVVSGTNYVAVGATVTADPAAGRNVASVNTTTGSNPVPLTSGTLGTADSTIVFKMPAAAVTVTFAA